MCEEADHTDIFINLFINLNYSYWALLRGEEVGEEVRRGEEEEEGKALWLQQERLDPMTAGVSE